MQKNANTKFARRQKNENRHISKILHDGSESWKFSSFERGYFFQNTCGNRHFSTKKALLASAHSREKRTEKGVILVQNVKNQFLHQLPWRGI